MSAFFTAFHITICALKMVLHELTGAHISQYHLKSVLTLMGPLTCSKLYIVYSNSLPPSYPDILWTPPPPSSHPRGL